MQEQNLKTHTRYVPVYHFVLWGISLAIILLSVYNLVSALESGSGFLQALLLALMAVALLINSVLVRSFPLRAQDRAIRAEENLRYFSLTGKLLD
ncbi:MAG TPA: DUF6526 family protein, partial [Puia sp.]